MLLFVHTGTRKGFVIFTCRYFKLIIKGHSQLWGRADLDTTFSSLKSVYLNQKSNVCVRYIQKSASILPSFSFDPFDDMSFLTSTDSSNSELFVDVQLSLDKSIGEFSMGYKKNECSDTTYGLSITILTCNQFNSTRFVQIFQMCFMSVSCDMQIS